MPFFRIAIGLAALGASAGAAAQSTAYTDPAAIDRSVAAFTGKPIGVPGGAVRPVDRRLRLAVCGGPLALAWYGSGRDNVKVECSDSRGWKLFVPVRKDAPGTMEAAAVPIVRRGESVSVVMRGRGFSVTASGEAMEAGAQGEWIRVKPENAKEPVRARVERPGLVTIPLS